MELVQTSFCWTNLSRLRTVVVSVSLSKGAAVFRADFALSRLHTSSRLVVRCCGDVVGGGSHRFYVDEGVVLPNVHSGARWFSPVDAGPICDQVWFSAISEFFVPFYVILRDVDDVPEDARARPVVAVNASGVAYVCVAEHGREGALDAVVEGQSALRPRDRTGIFDFIAESVNLYVDFGSVMYSATLQVFEEGEGVGKHVLNGCTE
mmetsp:Transcript_30625/g.41491  ORF Transcript_30625/g.41491 Transcript_30625/m.41491 type:complete len:207 (-) Transcript_30625:28-648(-)